MAVINVSYQVDVPFSDPTLLSTTTTTVPPPIARMAGEASTTAPVQPSYPSTVVPAHPATVPSGNASVLSTSGSCDCVHPKDLSCTKEKPYDGQTVSVGAMNKNGTCEGNSSSCPTTNTILKKVEENLALLNKTSVLGFL